ncbi:MAG: omptin family outer membrane protease [Desulfobulbaceae bacterium]|nr:omptin family outer membrane protease [Desulfobulbaceae bacterium]
MKKSIIATTALSLILGVAATAQAANVANRRADGSSTIRVSDQVMTVSGRLSVGMTTGTAHEVVHMPPGLTDILPRRGNLLSKLSWDIDNVVMLGAGVSVRPTSWLKFNADVAVAVTDGDGGLEDYDYAAANTDEWTHYSDSDADVEDGLLFDVNAELKFLTFRNTSVFGILGYKHDKWSWEATGGKYIYSTYYLRDTQGSLPNDRPGISYEQTFDTPYIGVGFNTDLSAVSLAGRFIFSTLVSADAEDTHHLRDLHYEDDMDDGRMIGLDLALTAPLTQRLSLIGSYHYQKYDDMDGGETITDLRTGQKESIDYNIAGMDQNLSVFALSLAYSF